MKGTKMTGYQIYRIIHDLKKDLKEINEGCETVMEKMGKESKAYKILCEKKMEKIKEIREFEAKEYGPYQVKQHTTFEEWTKCAE